MPAEFLSSDTPLAPVEVAEGGEAEAVVTGTGSAADSKIRGAACCISKAKVFSTPPPSCAVIRPLPVGGTVRNTEGKDVKGVGGVRLNTAVAGVRERPVQGAAEPPVKGMDEAAEAGGVGEGRESVGPGVCCMVCKPGAAVGEVPLGRGCREMGAGAIPGIGEGELRVS